VRECGLGIESLWRDGTLTFRWIDNHTVEQLLEDLHKARSGNFDVSQLKDAPQLERYKAVIGHAYALTGIVSGHPRLADGKKIVTSQLFYLDPERGIARTMNNWYRLSNRDHGREN